MTETLAYGYSSESTQRQQSNEYQHDRVFMVFQRIFVSFALDESSLSIGRVKNLPSTHSLLMTPIQPMVNLDSGVEYT